MPKFEHEDVRKSLELAFSSIFDRYNHDFSSDDELDLANMTVAKLGKKLTDAPAMPFGSIFKKNRGNGSLNSSSDSDTDEEAENASEEARDGALYSFFVSFRRNFTLQQALQEMSDDAIQRAFDEELMQRMAEVGQENILPLYSTQTVPTEFDSLLYSFVVASRG